MNIKLLNILKGTVLVLLLTYHQASKAQTGAALNFDATNDYVSVSSPSNIPVGNSPYTIEAWIKPNAWGTYGIIGWGNYGSVNQVNALRLDGSGGIYNYWWAHDLYVNPAVGIPSINLLDGNWHHVAATFDGTTRKLYVDGFLKGSDTPGSSHNVTSTANFRIGSTCTICGGEIFNGNIDEVRVWDIARTQCQINSYMKCEIPSTATGLVLNYHFNAGLAGMPNPGVNTISDFSGSSNTGTLTNFALTGPGSNWIAPGGVVSGFITPATTAPPTSIGVTANKSLVCLSENVVLTATGAVKYTWSLGFPGAVADFHPISTDTYTVTGYSSDTDCIGTSTTITVPTENCVGINNLNPLNENISIFPNPSNGYFTIELNNGVEKNIEVLDLTGKILLTQDSQLDKTSINLSQLANGIYFIKIKSNNQTRMVKIIKN